MLHDPPFRNHLFETIRDVYSFIFRWRGDLWRLTWPFVLLEFIYLWARFYAQGGPEHTLSNAASHFYTLLAIATLIPFAARIQHFALHPGLVQTWGGRRTARTVGTWTRALVHFLAPLITILFGASLLILGLSNPATQGLTMTNLSIGLAMTLGVSFLMARFLFVLPLAFEGACDQFGKSWQMTKGSYFFLFLLFGSSTVPFRLIYRLSDLTGTWVWSLASTDMSEKTALHFYAVFLPSTFALMGQLVIAIVTMTFAFHARQRVEAVI